MEDPMLDIKRDEKGAGELVANEDPGVTEAAAGDNSSMAREGGNNEACGTEVNWPGQCEEYSDIGRGEKLQEREKDSSCKADCLD